MANVSVNAVYGDGIELNALRGDGDKSGTILNPTENASLSYISIVGSGRQGITLASVSGAVISSVHLADIGIDVFDVEADQWDEGALDVIIDGCTVGGGNGGLFFANGGNGSGASWTGNVMVENCQMAVPDAGDAVMVTAIPGVPKPRGPFIFMNDTLLCGASVYVACVEVSGAQVSITDSSLRFPAGTVHEPVYDATHDTTLGFNQDQVSGYGALGTSGATSSVTVSGGLWSPYARPIIGRPAVAGDPGLETTVGTVRPRSLSTSVSSETRTSDWSTLPVAIELTRGTACTAFPAGPNLIVALTAPGCRRTPITTRSVMPSATRSACPRP